MAVEVVGWLEEDLVRLEKRAARAVVWADGVDDESAVFRDRIV